MFTHPETLCSLSNLDYQERLRHAANQRLAASVHTARHSRVGVGWLGGMLSQLRSASQRWVARPLTTGSAEPAHRAI